MLSMLPSYTQLGMAALLPRAPGQALAIAETLVAHKLLAVPDTGLFL